MLHVLRSRSGLDWTIKKALWLSEFRINERQVDQYCHGRVILAGDAAHIHSPAGGQGMNTSIQDAVNLSWKLAMVIKRQATSSLLTTYQDERHPVGACSCSGFRTDAPYHDESESTYWFFSSLGVALYHWATTNT